MAAVFNFAAYFFIKDHKVANTVSKIVLEHYVTLHVILAGLVAAITWNLFTWWFGIPSSSSHTLIGGFAGAGMTNALYMGAMPCRLLKCNMCLKLLLISYWPRLLV
jgi:PiT family inorganic phosphate transporter